MSKNRFSGLSVLHRKVLLGSVLVIGAATLIPSNHELLPQRIPVQLDIESILSQNVALPSSELLEPAPAFQKEIVKGDTLSGLFEQGGVDQQTMYRVLEADLNVLALDTLMPGNNIQFWLNDAGELQKLSLYFNAARQVIFTRFDDGSFNVDEINIEGIWRDRAISGQIHGSFYVSAKKMGLNAAEIQRVESLLKEKLNFARDLRAGDKFSVLMNDQFIDGEATGNSHVLGVTIDRGSSSINA
ncbi:LysM-like peptidoglycan-binding domain-containing protein, partial [Shewanella sp. 0m-11]